jgi:hypothetical protein
VLLKDLDFKNIANFVPQTFTGTFDGQGHTIKNLNYTTTDTAVTEVEFFLGLFGKICTSTTIKNLAVDNIVMNYTHIGGYYN